MAIYTTEHYKDAKAPLEQLLELLALPNHLQEQLRHDGAAEVVLAIGPDHYEILIEFSNGESISHGFNVKD